jgi:hypothetical protein
MAVSAEVITPEKISMERKSTHGGGQNVLAPAPTVF